MQKIPFGSIVMTVWNLPKMNVERGSAAAVPAPVPAAATFSFPQAGGFIIDPILLKFCMNVYYTMIWRKNSPFLYARTRL